MFDTNGFDEAELNEGPHGARQPAWLLFFFTDSAHYFGFKEKWLQLKIIVVWLE